MRHRFYVIILSIFMCLCLANCAGSQDELEYVEKPAEQLYNEGKENLDHQKYKKAMQLFDEVDRQHPYSSWATKAQLMAAYAAYEDLDYDMAIIKLERFIDLHPGNDEIAYAYYLRALCYYEQISDVRRDQKMTEFALVNLDEVIRRFPNTEYARDAKLKRDLAVDHLAGKDMSVGRYYQNQGYINAAIQRYTHVLQHYQTTAQTPEALYRMVESYMTLGLDDEAQKYAAVLGYNYPDSSWYKRSYALVEDTSYGDEEKELIIKKWWRAFISSE